MQFIDICYYFLNQRSIDTALLQVCRQFRAEDIPFFIRLNTVVNLVSEKKDI